MEDNQSISSTGSHIVCSRTVLYRSVLSCELLSLDNLPTPRSHPNNSSLNNLSSENKTAETCTTGLDPSYPRKRINMNLLLKHKTNPCLTTERKLLPIVFKKPGSVDSYTPLNATINYRNFNA